MPPINRREAICGFAVSVTALSFARRVHADDIIIFELTRTSVKRVELGAEEPDQKLTLVTVWLTEAGTAALIRLTMDNIGKGLVIAMPDGRRFGPNRIEKPATGRKLGMVLPSDAALALAAAINEV